MTDYILVPGNVLLAESGNPLIAENGNFICYEFQPWNQASSGSGTWIPELPSSNPWARS